MDDPTARVHQLTMGIELGQATCSRIEGDATIETAAHDDGHAVTAPSSGLLGNLQQALAELHGVVALHETRHSDAQVIVEVDRAQRHEP